MNIFYLAKDPGTAARRHCDQHVNKMILESAQMLSTVAHHYGLKSDNLYAPTHAKHPCTLWLMDSLTNCNWVYNLVFFLNQERKLRFASTEPHKSFRVVRDAYLLLWSNPDKFENLRRPVAQAMPDECKTDDPVQAYQAYYCLKNSQWTEKGRPMKYYGMPLKPEQFLTFSNALS